MAKGITIKVPTHKLLAQLESKLAEFDRHAEDYPKLREAHKREVEAWKEKVLAKAKKSLSSATHTTVDTHYYGSPQVRVSLTFNQDDMPEYPTDKSRDGGLGDPTGYTFIESRNELAQAIRLLKMTDEEYVSTATYRSVTRFL